MAIILLKNFQWKLVTLSIALCLMSIYMIWLIPLERYGREGIINTPTAWGFFALSTLVLFPLATAFVVFRLAAIHKLMQAGISLILIFIIIGAYIQVLDSLTIRQYETARQTLIGGAPRIVSFSDSLRDENQDGIFEALIIKLEIELPTAGKFYDIRADLVDQEGRVISQQKASLSMTKTEQLENNILRKRISLRIDGKSIFQHGVDGPYTLQNVYIVSEVAGQVLHKQIAHITPAYMANQFKSY